MVSMWLHVEPSTHCIYAGTTWQALRTLEVMPYMCAATLSLCFGPDGAFERLTKIRTHTLLGCGHVTWAHSPTFSSSPHHLRGETLSVFILYINGKTGSCSCALIFGCWRKLAGWPLFYFRCCFFVCVKFTLVSYIISKLKCKRGYPALKINWEKT